MKARAEARIRWALRRRRRRSRSRSRSSCSNSIQELDRYQEQGSVRRRPPRRRGLRLHPVRPLPQVVCQGEKRCLFQNLTLSLLKLFTAPFGVPTIQFVAAPAVPPHKKNLLKRYSLNIVFTFTLFFNHIFWVIPGNTLPFSQLTPQILQQHLPPPLRLGFKRKQSFHIYRVFSEPLPATHYNHSTPLNQRRHAEARQSVLLPWRESQTRSMELKSSEHIGPYYCKVCRAAKTEILLADFVGFCKHRKCIFFQKFRKRLSCYT